MISSFTDHHNISLLYHFLLKLEIYMQPKSNIQRKFFNLAHHVFPIWTVILALVLQKKNDPLQPHSSKLLG